MPAAAVIPAPIAYINVVAVKKLVVEFRRFACPGRFRIPKGFLLYEWTFTVNKLKCSEQAFA